MVKVKEDLTGRRFGRLTVLYQGEDYVNPKGVHYARWRCKCSCKDENIVDVSGSSLKRGGTTSCGCLHKENVSKKNRKRFKGNKYNLFCEYGIGWTSNTNKEFYFDLEDYDLIKNYTWWEDEDSRGYHSLKSRDRKTNKIIKFQWVIGFKGCDHKDRNPLNNRKENLRECTFMQNRENSSMKINNTSGIIGVNWDKKSQKWRARIMIDGRSMELGFFSNKDDATKARLVAEDKYFKDFAPQAHLFEAYGVNINTNI